MRFASLRLAHLRASNCPHARAPAVLTMACPAPSLRLTLCNTLVPDAEFLVLACIVASACAFTKSMPLMSRSKLAMSKQLETPRIVMSLETSSLAQVSQTLAGVVAVDGGTSEGCGSNTWHCPLPASC